MLKICSIGSRIGVSLFHSLSLSFSFLFHYIDTPKEKKVKLVSFGGVCLVGSTPKTRLQEESYQDLTESVVALKRKLR